MKNGAGRRYRGHVLDRRRFLTMSVTAIAARASLSSRQLERLFRKYLGQAPTRYYLGLRLERARHLLLQTSMPILSIGLACGFVSASHFSKCYSEHFSRTPSQERRNPRRGASERGQPVEHV